MPKTPPYDGGAWFRVDFETVAAQPSLAQAMQRFDASTESPAGRDGGTAANSVAPRVRDRRQGFRNADTSRRGRGHPVLHALLRPSRDSRGRQTGGSEVPGEAPKSARPTSSGWRAPLKLPMEPLRQPSCMPALSQAIWPFRRARGYSRWILTMPRRKRCGGNGDSSAPTPLLLPARGSCVYTCRFPKSKRAQREWSRPLSFTPAP